MSRKNNDPLLDTPLPPKKKGINRKYLKEAIFTLASFLALILSFGWLFYQKTFWNYEPRIPRGNNTLPGILFLTIFWGILFLLRTFFSRDILNSDDDLHLTGYAKNDSYYYKNELSTATIIFARSLFYGFIAPLFFAALAFAIHVFFILSLERMLSEQELVGVAYSISSIVIFIIIFITTRKHLI